MPRIEYFYATAFKILIVARCQRRVVDAYNGRDLSVLLADWLSAGTPGCGNAGVGSRRLAVEWKNSSKSSLEQDFSRGDQMSPSLAGR